MQYRDQLNFTTCFLVSFSFNEYFHVFNYSLQPLKLPSTVSKLQLQPQENVSLTKNTFQIQYGKTALKYDYASVSLVINRLRNVLAGQNSAERNTATFQG